MFVHWPGTVRCDFPVIATDFYPTLFRTRPVSVIRKGEWKLLLFHEEWQQSIGAPIPGDPNPEYLLR